MKESPWPLQAQYLSLLAMATTLDDLAAIWENIMENPGLTEADRANLEEFSNRVERVIRGDLNT